ncbi:MAG TPA: hypothetical protein PLM34_06820 [Lentimicrobium sp.]|nr:hypothetical protein [Lentimicrobium sp.]
MEYLYDANGNLIKDANKGIIEINYNFLNLPGELKFTGNKRLSYLYNANGNKIRQDVILANLLDKRTDFISNVVFISNTPAWINFDEGRVIINQGAVYYFTETHLTSQPRPLPDYSGRGQGEVQQDEMNLGWLDYGARFYDP